MKSIQFMLARAFLICQYIILGLVSWSPFQRSINSADPKHILLLRTSALGDFIFAIPAMVALRDRHPDAKITLITATSPAYRAIEHPAYHRGETLPWLSFMVPSVINEAICVHSFAFKSLWTEIRRRVANLNPDMTVILAHPGEPGMSLLKKIVFLRLIGVRSAIYGWRTRATTSHLRQVQYDAGLYDHHVVGPLRSVSELPGMPVIEKIKIRFPLDLDPLARSWAEDLWRNKGWSESRVIAVVPGSVQPHKRWPMKNFISLCKELMLRLDVQIVIIGSSSDKSASQELVDAINAGVLNLAGETSLSQSAALLERCSLVIGNDGGAMHLGSAMGSPVVSIVPGIEYPNSIEPWCSRDLAVRHPISCAPCYSFTQCPEGHNRCMKDLPVRDVYEKCLRVLGDDSRRVSQHGHIHQGHN